MIDFEAALERLLADVSPLGAERASIESAAGRVLAEDLTATSPLPPFDHSSMDGYAVRASDFAGGGPWELPVIGESAAGGEASKLAEGAAMRIFTGARLPRGADAIVIQENVSREGDRARFTEAPIEDRFIRRRGEDLAEGAIALARGTRLRPGHVALAAALDHPTLAVARRPVITILASGDELRSPGEPGRPGSIAESNAYFVAAAARGCGAIARVAPFVSDDLARAKVACERALRGSDLVVTIGGVSVGDRDVMRAALEAAGVTIDFWRVRIKPGKPLAVGRRGDAFVLGLPGNPGAASLTFSLFGAPLLRALQGDLRPLPARIKRTIRGSLARETGRQEFLRATLEREGDSIVARLFANQASGAVTSFAVADALVVVPADRATIEDGDALETIALDAI